MHSFLLILSAYLPPRTCRDCGNSFIPTTYPAQRDELIKYRNSGLITKPKGANNASRKENQARKKKLKRAISAAVAKRLKREAKQNETADASQLQALLSALQSKSVQFEDNKQDKANAAANA